MRDDFVGRGLIAVVLLGGCGFPHLVGIMSVFRSLHMALARNHVNNKFFGYGN